MRMYLYAKGFRQFFSTSEVELQDYLSKMDLAEPGNNILRDVFSELLGIHTLDDLHQNSITSGRFLLLSILNLTTSSPRKRRGDIMDSLAAIFN